MNDLVEYGEDDAVDWVSSCSDDEFLRICGVADWLLLKVPGTPSGASMMVAKATALAAVFVREGAPRPLKRKRRKVGGDVPAGIGIADPLLDERPNPRTQQELVPRLKRLAR